MMERLTDDELHEAKNIAVMKFAPPSLIRRAVEEYAELRRQPAAIDVEGFAKRWNEVVDGDGDVAQRCGRLVQLVADIARAVLHAPDARDTTIAELKKQNDELQKKLNAFIDIAVDCAALARKDGTP